VEGELRHYDTDYAVFLERVRAARRDAGLRQVDVAARLGRKQGWVSKIETGEVHIDFIELVYLARLYGKPLAYFEPPPHEPQPGQ
jgi:transcriptional regulator with XRE-family HTH domain